MCTRKYLGEVMNQTCFCFQISYVQRGQLLQPPPNHLLQKMLVEGIEYGLERKLMVLPKGRAPVERLMQHVRNRLSNKEWYIDMLMTLTKVGVPIEIAKPGYRYSRNPKKYAPILN